MAAKKVINLQVTAGSFGEAAGARARLTGLGLGSKDLGEGFGFVVPVPPKFPKRNLDAACRDVESQFDVQICPM